MASPDHKAGLAVVVPISDIRSPTLNQHALNIPRKSLQPIEDTLAYLPNGTVPPQRSIGAPYAGHQQPNGVAFSQPSNGTLPARTWLPGVDEALQYSPFSSIVPFKSDIIPVPGCNLSGSRPTFTTLLASRQPLDLLNKELARTQGQSNIVQHARRDLKSLLNRDAITNFKFKAPAGFNGSRPHLHAASNGNSHKDAPSNVGAFADMMLHATDLAHRYPTPTSPEDHSPAPKTEKKPRQWDTPQSAKVTVNVPLLQPSLPVTSYSTQTNQQKSPVTPSGQRFIQNEIAYSNNAKLSATSTYDASTDHPLPMPIVKIPPLSAESRQSDYVTYEEPLGGEKNAAPRKRKREGEAQNSGALSQTKDQRAASNELFSHLQEVIQDIFEADDQAQSDSAGPNSSTNVQYFLMVYSDDQERRTLSPAIHVKLESSIHKVINIGRLAEIPVEHLQRLQGLCGFALSSAQSSDLLIDPEWNTDDFASWVQRLDSVNLGLRSARTVLRIMAGGREEKQLYSEELLQSVLGVIKKVLDQCIVPIVEARSSSAGSTFSEAASSHKKAISQLLSDVIRVMALLAKLLSKIEIAEIIITGIEFFATPLLFVENAHSEKESVLGIQKFESLRHTAMDMIATIFLRYPEQRLFLFDEILSSLQKLPSTRQHARHFRLDDGTSIQLVSALMMRLVQTSAVKVVKKIQRLKLMEIDNDQASGSESLQAENAKPTNNANSDDSEGSARTEESYSRSALKELSNDATSLFGNAAKSAQYVVRYLIQRAMTASKSGDQPHRHLLDMFVEDFITVLGQPEWPAAELLLCITLGNCRNIAENSKSLAPAKNMALELLGLMGSAISELVSNTRHAARSLEGNDAAFSGYLRQMLDDYTEGSLENSELVGWEGPFHAVVEYLQSNSSDNLHIGSAQDFYLARWAKTATSGLIKADLEGEKLAIRLCKMLSRAEWVTSDAFVVLTNSQLRIAYALTVLSMDFCRQFDYILKLLFDSVSSEQITVRTRSLKSVTQMLEKDPSLLDRTRNVRTLITNCATDASSMVRDSALTLIGKCITLRPAFAHDFLRHVLRLSDDPATGVRKRSIKMLKDIYLRNTEKTVKAAIGDSLLQRARDLDTGVSDLARQTFEEIWFSPFQNIPELVDASVHDKVALQTQVGLIVSTVQRGEKTSSVLVYLLQEILSIKSKNVAANFRVCKSLVATAFDIMIDNTHEVERLGQNFILQTLTVFARANARLFTPDQLHNLQPYITNLSGKDDLDLFRSIVIIFRCVLPVLSTVQHGLLQEIHKALLHSVSRLGKAELNEVAECLWTINRTLQNPEPLIKLTASVLKNLRGLEASALNFADTAQGDNLRRTKKYIQIAGSFGKHCDFEKYSGAFQNLLDWWKGGSVAGLIVQSIQPFTRQGHPLALRAEAFDSIGLICQSWPYQFTQEQISNAFQDILRNGEPELQNIVLSSFREFFARIDRQAEAKIEDATVSADYAPGGKLGGSMRASDGDGASALIAQRFLKDILSIALASQDNSALAATEVIASINRQGLVHPKESGPALVALETSTNPAIANVAFYEHRLLHQQHESMFEREYMRAISEAFRYQKDIVKDTLGYTKQPYASKLCGMFEIIKTSKSKYQKKFLSNFCSKIDFDVSKMDSSGSPPQVLQFSKFLIENLAFFDYGRVDELSHTLSCMEKIVADTGSGIAHSISTEIFHITVESMPDDTAPHDHGSDKRSDIKFDQSRLRQLATASIMLSILWEARTYLRRLYGLSPNQPRREGKKAVAKDVSKAPTRVQGFTGDKMVAAIAEKVDSLESQELMVQQCKEFVELLSVDNEIKVAAEGEEDVEHPETPSEDEERDTPMSGGSRTLKRKGSISNAGTPMKKKRGRPPVGKSRKSGKSVDSDEGWE